MDEAATPARIRRPAAEDFREAPLVRVLRDAAEIADEASAGARLGAARLLQFAGWLLFLAAATPALLLAFGKGLPFVPGLLVVYAGVGFFAAAFWAGCGRGPWRRRLRDRRARLEGQEDTVEMRRLILALEPGREPASHGRAAGID